MGMQVCVKVSLRSVSARGAKSNSTGCKKNKRTKRERQRIERVRRETSQGEKQKDHDDEVVGILRIESRRDALNIVCTLRDEEEKEKKREKTESKKG
jgi:hypothetical protein